MPICAICILYTEGGTNTNHNQLSNTNSRSEFYKESLDYSGILQEERNHLKTLDDIGRALI